MPEPLHWSHVELAGRPTNWNSPALGGAVASRSRPDPAFFGRGALVAVGGPFARSALGRESGGAGGGFRRGTLPQSRGVDGGRRTTAAHDHGRNYPRGPGEALRDLAEAAAHHGAQSSPGDRDARIRGRLGAV